MQQAQSVTSPKKGEVRKKLANWEKGTSVWVFVIRLRVEGQKRTACMRVSVCGRLLTTCFIKLNYAGLYFNHLSGPLNLFINTTMG